MARCAEWGDYSAVGLRVDPLHADAPRGNILCGQSREQVKAADRKREARPQFPSEASTWLAAQPSVIGQNGQLCNPELGGAVGDEDDFFQRGS